MGRKKLLQNKVKETCTEQQGQTHLVQFVNKCIVAVFVFVKEGKG